MPDDGTSVLERSGPVSRALGSTSTGPANADGPVPASLWASMPEWTQVLSLAIAATATA